MINEKKIETDLPSRFGVQSIVGDSLSGTVEQNKKVFDRLPEEIINAINSLIDYMHNSGYDDYPIAMDFKYIKLTAGHLEVSEDNKNWIVIGGGSGDIGDISNSPVLFHEDTTQTPLTNGDKLTVLWGKQLRINNENEKFREEAEKHYAVDFIIEQKTTPDGWEYTKYQNGKIEMDKTEDVTVGAETSVNGLYRAKADVKLGTYLNKITSITAGAQNSGIVLQACVNGSDPEIAELFAISTKHVANTKFENVPIHVVGKWK